MKRAGAGKEKGNSFEWDIARKISLWLTGGEDKSQLIRSVMSGGHAGLRSQFAKKAENQVGDLAPNGPQGEWFRNTFGIECKNYKADPDWWHAITSECWIVEGWWKKINEECSPNNLQPLLIMKRNGRPVVVMMDSDLCHQAGVKADLTLPKLGVAVLTIEHFFYYTPKTWVDAAKWFIAE